MPAFLCQGLYFQGNYYSFYFLAFIKNFLSESEFAELKNLRDRHADFSYVNSHFFFPVPLRPHSIATGPSESRPL